ncbi:hypothetical protein DL89DRAFT_264746 [Linderina pennispora]|uniref:Ion transport domain-containing protein n=1 Tax=Linderina pennispora TaxID=61395 RepID=A0A1Y1WN15_9FUNG|nr:uncharacterized protein DL89DRAFT_264746 [Linderina pennispora]ORX74957.1 hypothetical protein DL89DRAFT_264746 [Linderina pennispora]
MPRRLQAGTSFRLRLGDTTSQPSYNSVEPYMEIADDKNPVCAYFEIVTLRSLLLEHVSVVLSSTQLHSPDVQINLIAPLWQAIRDRCGVWRRGDMRHTQEAITSETLSGPLVSAAMLYAALANRDYFLVLASAGQSQAEQHQSRAEVAETIAIMCVKALHKLGKRDLENALCTKFSPIDLDSMRLEMANAMHNSNATVSEWQLPNPVRGEQHMSLMSAEHRVRVYRLGRAGDVVDDSGSHTPTQRTWGSGIMGGWSTPATELAQIYLGSRSRLVVERALEVAIRSEAKRFTAQKVVGDVVQLLWDGTLHWKGYQCVCIAQPSANTPAEPGPPPRRLSDAVLTIARRDSSRSNASVGLADDIHDMLDPLLPQVSRPPHRTWQARLEKQLASILSPLRIPMFENILTMVHAFFFLVLYSTVSMRRQPALSAEELVLHICVLAYIADEIRQCMENGIVVYIKSVWNVLDITIYSIFSAFFILRIRSWYTGSDDDLDKAYDVLALNAAMMWPRLFAVLDQFEFCGTIIIQVRRIIAGTSLFFALLLVFIIGFFQTFYALGSRHNKLAASEISGLMARIFFGSAVIGWDRYDLCMVEITENSSQEFRFLYTMRVTEYVSAKQTYPCVPPLNLLQIGVFWPLRKTAISTRTFALLRSTTLLIAYAPHLVLYCLYKTVGRWWRAKSGMHRKALRAECFLAERELALIKIDNDDSATNTRKLSGAVKQDRRRAVSPSNPASPKSLGKLSDERHGRGWASFLSAWSSQRKERSAATADTERRLAELDARMADINSQLATITRLLKPVIQDD